MSIQERANITDHKLAAEVGDSLVIGNCFAFVRHDVFKTSKMNWLQKLFGTKLSDDTSVLSLMDSSQLEIFGAEIKPVSLGKLDLWSITSDKAVYKSDEDTVDLLLINPMRASIDMIVQIWRNNLPYTTRSVKIGKNGEAKITLQDLPTGDYSVYFDGCADKSKYCKFTVAQYKLVPLVAELKSKTLDKSGLLQMSIFLTSFGVPVDGDVRVRVVENDLMREQIQASAKDGICNISVKLEGAGPHSLLFQIPNESSKTASLPIIGSRASERSQTLFNSLGSEIFGSLLPSENSTEVRGLYLTEGGITSTPVRLEYDDDKNALLKASSKLKKLRICRVDPTFPHARMGALTAQNQHPSHYDTDYNAALKLFERGLYKDSLETFKAARAKQVNPHPYYAYFAACCFAKLGEIDAAIDELRLSIYDGWTEFKHMENDEDLSALRNDPRFQRLTTGGLSEFEFENVDADAEIQIPFLHGLTVLLLGAVTEAQQLWEGWTSHVSKPLISVDIKCGAEHKSGDVALLKVKLHSNSPGSVYLLVKDARLVSMERPDARLAASMKDYVETQSKVLSIGNRTDTLKGLTETLITSTRYRNMNIGMLGGAALMDEADGWGSLRSVSAQPQAFSEEGATTGGWAAQNEGWSSGSASDSWGVSSEQPAAGAGFSPASSPSAPTRPGGMAHRAPAPNSPAQMVRQKRAVDVSNLLGGSAGGASAALLDEESPGPAVPIKKGAEPEVLFADFLNFDGDEASVEIFLPLQESDYVIECFAIADFDWCFSDTRFRAVSDPLAEFTLPRFVSRGEHAQSWLHLGCRSKEFSCEITCDGKPIQLKLNGAEYSKTDLIKDKLINLEFPAGPGNYSVKLRDNRGAVIANINQNVDEPGKLKRRLRGVRLLQAGESVSLSDDPSIISMRLLPGLEQKFNVMLEATANYSHCCCEQTAAKILSSCMAYIFAGNDSKRKSKAEAAIIAGIKREEKMWLPGRGFKMYPECANNPDGYLGKIAAQHLVNLEHLNSAALSSDLRQAVDLGLKMAVDVLRAQNVVHPPAEITSIRDAYLVVSTAGNGGDSAALKAYNFVKSRVPNADAFVKSIPPSSIFGNAVYSRMEASYAAATLIRERGSMIGEAIQLANFVVKSINHEGRLYSTSDSAAAIALFAELSNANLISGTGASSKLEVDGMVEELASALRRGTDVQSFKCTEGILAVEVETEIIEDWSVFDSKLQLRVSLEKNGSAVRSFNLGDQVDLRVKLEDGYKNGDLLWVCLPDSLSRVYGGAQIKMFSMDFCGNSEIVIPLAVTGKTLNAKGEKAQQKMALCVRNMFEEERGGNPGLIGVTVT